MTRLGLIAWLLASAALAKGQVHYMLSYTDSASGKVTVTIRPATPLAAPMWFVMPRSIPGSYSMLKYDLFADHLRATDTSGRTLAFFKDHSNAPRWLCADTGLMISSISYEIDIDRMEKQLFSASDKSILRKGFAGLLNYTIFGWIEGTEEQPVQCTVQTFSQWPIFSTIAPSASPAEGRLEFSTENYYTLADAQTFMGPNFQVKEFKGLVPLYIAAYSEMRPEYLDDYAWQETKSMEILKDYFGELPFSQYSLMLRKAIPPTADEQGSFGMEHLQSSTFFGDTSRPRTHPIAEDRRWLSMPTYLHHMAHAFIPLRCYGDAYRPHVMEIPPIINNVWFNEGFMWYIVADTLKDKWWLDYFQDNVRNAAPAIKKMSLQQLSETASLQYADDFRLGVAVYSRGAMMAREINEYVKWQTGGKKSMKTIYRYLYEWSCKNKRPFTMDEFPGLLKAATGVDVSAIYNKWQQPPVP